MSHRPNQPYWWMLSSAFSFACMGTFTHALGAHCDWRLIATARTFLALVFAGSISVLAGVPLVWFEPKTLWTRSIAGSISLICSFYALTHLPVAESLTLSNMFPLWVALLSWPLLGRPPRPTVWLSIFSAILGVIVIQQPHPEYSDARFASFIGVLGSMATSVAMMGLHRLRRIDARAIVVHFSAVSSVVAAAALFSSPSAVHSVSQVNGTLLLMLLGIGVAATAGQIAMTRAFAIGDPSRVAVIALTQIVFAILFDILFFGRGFEWSALLGIGLIMVPAALLMALGDGMDSADENQSMATQPAEAPVS